jgi:hypothetical protein
MPDYDGVAEIRRAGVSPEGLCQVDLRLTGAADWNWFLSTDGLSREMLAVALAAIVANKTLSVQIKEPVTTWARVYRCLINK